MHTETINKYIEQKWSNRESNKWTKALFKDLLGEKNSCSSWNEASPDQKAVLIIVFFTAPNKKYRVIDTKTYPNKDDIMPKERKSSSDI